MAKFEQQWSPEVIAECARRHRDGESLRALALETGIPRSTLGRRIKEHHLGADHERRAKDAARQGRKTIERHLADLAPESPEQARAKGRPARPRRGGRILNWERQGEIEWLDENERARAAAARRLAR